MSDFNTFTGKTVDDAISEACRFFSTERDRLEVEIISGGSTGIFGLVGKKKAQVRARRRQDPAVAAMIEDEERKSKAAAKAAASEEARQPEPAREPAPRRDAGQNGQSPRAASPAPRRDDALSGQAEREVSAEAAQESGQDRNRERGQRQRDQRRDKPQKSREPREAREPREPREPKQGRPRREQAAKSEQRPKAEPRPKSGRSADSMDDDLPEGHDQSPASEELLSLASDIMTRLLTPILEQEPKMEIEGTASRLSVLIQDEEHSGLLIGREGQTLAALQYLANRIMARKWESPVRVQINTGEYREKQDDNLRKMAFYLADKARNLGRPQSTKPLSSYHRRVIHMALQGDETIQTRSKGDGPMKRVIIVPKRPKGDAPQPEQTLAPAEVETTVQEQTDQQAL